MKFLHNLLLSWIDSLKVFTFNNLKLNFLIILKTFKDAIKNITKPAYAAYLLLELLFCILFSNYINLIMPVEMLLSLLMFSLFIYTIKPTVELRGTKIWFLHLMLFQLLCVLMPFLIYTLLWVELVMLCFVGSLFFGVSEIGSCCSTEVHYRGRGWLMGLGLCYMIKLLASTSMLHIILYGKQFGFNPYYFTAPLILFLTFFLLDSKKDLVQYLKAFLRAFLMFLYNYPCCFIAYNILWLLIKLDTGLIAKFFPGNTIIETIVTVFNILILFFIYTIFLMNFYINQIHTKFDLYYKSRYVKL